MLLKQTCLFLYLFVTAFHAFASPSNTKPSITSNTELEGCQLDKATLKQLPSYRVQQVIDGDSIILSRPDNNKSNSEHIRLIGINTPEINKEQALAKDAQRFLQTLTTQQDITVLYGKQRRDKHNRSLAHLFLEDGRNIEAIMLEQGLGFLVAIPPNTQLLDCQEKARDRAKMKNLGVWQEKSYNWVDVSNLSGQHAGFARIEGKVKELSISKKHWWLRLEGDAVLQIKRHHQANFSLAALQALKGKTIQASGWMIDRRKRLASKPQRAGFVLLLTHPAHMHIRGAK